MFTRKKDFLCVWFLSVVFVFAVAAWAQHVPSDDASPSTPGSSTSHPAPSSAGNDVAIHDNVPGHDSAPGVIQIEVTEVGAEPPLADNKMPATLTVKTATLLELHEMRQSAVDLCLQLPTKYRTRLPQCADIFKHEIRLKALAKHTQ